MLALILTNLRRRVGRTVLTSFGVGVGVATIVALLSVSAGLTRAAAGLVNLGGSDLGVFQAAVADPTASLLPLSLVHKLDQNPHIAAATPLLLIVGKVKGSPPSFVFGAQPDGFVARRLIYVEGRPARGSEVVVGSVLASSLHLHTGGTLVVGGHALRIVGVYHSGVPYEDDGAFLPLAFAQRLVGDQGEATTIAVELAPGVSKAMAQRSIERQLPHTNVFIDPGEAARAGANTVLIQNATLVFIVIALIVGGISVTNTMAMAVLERQGELALLSAMGWSAGRVATLIVGEGVAVSLIGAGLGLLLGVLGSQLLVGVLGVGEFVSPAITAWGLGRGLLVGVSIGVLGGIWPAWRVTRMPPLKGLARA
jgi:putative ABC transport system permease protein